MCCNGNSNRKPRVLNLLSETMNREHFASHVIGNCSRLRVREPVVIMRAAARMSAPPVRALGPRLSCSRMTPSSEPMSGSMLSRTPACDAGTWVRPQFQSRVVDAVQSRPLAASASQTLGVMAEIFGGPKGWR